jgi:hypothetical protein
VAEPAIPIGRERSACDLPKRLHFIANPFAEETT